MQHTPGSTARVLLVNRDLAAGDQVRVNIRSVANMAAIRREKRNGRDVVIVPSATMPDDVVMNSILYPAAEIERSFASLERTPAPLGHPEVNGKFMSAKDPEGINVGWIGAWNENVVRRDGRVFLDKVIDVTVANQSEGGKRVLAAIDAGAPIHTSTGLLCNLEAANGPVTHKFTARNIEFDHDAILLDEDGAATPAQGVGMMVNAAGDEIQVVNSVIEDDADRELGWAVDQAVRALEKKARAPFYERITRALTEAILGSEREQPSTNKSKDDEMDKSQFDALSQKVDALSESLKPDALGTVIGNAVAEALKPVTDHLTSITNDQKAKDEAELTQLREQIVNAKIMDETAAAELTLNAARALAPKKTAPAAAATLAPGLTANTGNKPPVFKAPKAED